MTNLHALSLLPLLVACASAPAADPSSGPAVHEARVGETPAARPVEASAATGEPDAQGALHAQGAAPAPVEPVARTAAAAAQRPVEAPPCASELDLWKDPGFRRRFMESHVAETEVEPTVTLDERETLQKVLDLMGEEKVGKARELLRKNSSEAASAVFDFLEASLDFGDEDWDAAQRGYERAIRKYPKFRRAWKNLGFIHARRDEFALAAEAFTKVIALGDATADVYGLLGIAYSNLENPLAAESAYRMAILLAPGAPDWKTGLASSLFRQRRFADAVALFDTLIAAEPGNARLWLLQANAYVGLERPMQAAQNFEMADALGAATPASLTSLGDIYVNEGLYDTAVERYLRALEDGDGSPARALRAARVMTAQNALDETRALLDGVEERLGARLEDDTRKELLKLRARVALAEGAGDEEARILEEIVTLDPLDGEALILLGQHADRSGDPEQAIFYFERAESIESSEPDACVRHAQLLVRMKRYPDALRLLGRAQRIRPRESIQEFMEQVERVAQKR